MPTTHSFSMLNEANVNINVRRSENAFRFMLANQLKVKIMHAVMSARKVQLFPFVFLAGERYHETSDTLVRVSRVRVCFRLGVAT